MSTVWTAVYTIQWIDDSGRQQFCQTTDEGIYAYTAGQRLIMRDRVLTWTNPPVLMHPTMEDLWNTVRQTWRAPA